MSYPEVGNNQGPAWSVLGAVLFDMSVSDPEEGMEDTYIKAADDTKGDQLVHSRAGLPFTGSWSRWRKRLTGTPQNSA